MFSLGEAVILTGMDSYSPDYQSEFWMQMDAKSSRDNSVGSAHPLCSSSQIFALGHSHTLLGTQTKGSHTRVHLCSSYPFSLSPNFLLATKFHTEKFHLVLSFGMTA